MLVVVPRQELEVMVIMAALQPEERVQPEVAPGEMAVRHRQMAVWAAAVVEVVGQADQQEEMAD